MVQRIRKIKTGYYSQNEFSKIVGVSRQSIISAIKTGSVIDVDGGIDPNHPQNQIYMVEAQARKKRKEIKPKIKKVKRKKKRGPGRPRKHDPIEPRKRKATKKELKEYEEKKAQEEKEEDSRETPEGIEEDKHNDLAIQKIIEDIRLKKTKADLASLDLSRKMDVMIDRESLLKKFGAFFDCILNDLVYMPEEISDLLVMKVRSHGENAEQIVEDELKIRIKEIIKTAKVAAAEIVPPDKGIKYIIIDDEDEEIDIKDAV